MNRYPLWKYITVAIALVLGFVYTLPNFFGESPAVQVSSAKATIKVDDKARARVEDALKTAGITHDGMQLDLNGVKTRFKDTDTQLKAKDILEKTFNPDTTDPQYVVALNLLAASPQWLTSLHALPMYLGLDLRGGVHFLLQVDMKGALTKRLDPTSADLRTVLRDKNLRHTGVNREGDRLVVKFRDQETRDKARNAIADSQPDLTLTEQADGSEFKLTATLKPEAQKRIGEFAIKQNITTLHNRINELGVAEPVIQQQGTDRIVVQLPGVQDTAKAKDILGRTATLEVRMVEDDQQKIADAFAGKVAPGLELVPVAGVRSGQGSAELLKTEVELTGDNITKAEPTYDQNNNPVIGLSLDSTGASIFRTLTRDSVGKRMAIVLVEKGKGQVITAPRINAELGGSFVIEGGGMTVQEANDISLLVRAGSLAAPMNIVEERTIGPSLGKENIEKGFHSTLYGFIAIAIFMVIYYRVFGFVSAVALSANVLLLLALLSAIGITLTLPGIAAIALALGMAIDSNVLINERIREELRNGMSPQMAIQNGYSHAWATILDSNITTLIAGIALFMFGSGAVRGFAVVHCLGILTSMFSAVMVSRAMINLIYGYRRRLTGLSIGQVWVPQQKQA
ncbi:MAG TPA: protein translocase subunit SecD [Chitinolyticbacter sp.]|nr:protein translocase subunit SecD [Chitinolyticbacter sp.]